jgi:hypothetical protein
MENDFFTVEWMIPSGMISFNLSQYYDKGDDHTKTARALERMTATVIDGGRIKSYSTQKPCAAGRGSAHTNLLCQEVQRHHFKF